MMRWLFIALVGCGMFYVFANFAPSFWASRYTLPIPFHFYHKFYPHVITVSYALTALVLVGALSIAKLKFGK